MRDGDFRSLPANIYLFKVNSRNTGKTYEICSKLTVEAPKRRHWRRFGVFNINFEHISHFFLVSLLLTLDKYMLARFVLLKMLLSHEMLLKHFNQTKAITFNKTVSAGFKSMKVTNETNTHVWIKKKKKFLESI